jgi:hypothetical protein
MILLTMCVLMYENMYEVMTILLENDNNENDNENDINENNENISNINEK